MDNASGMDALLEFLKAADGGLDDIRNWSFEVIFVGGFFGPRDFFYLILHFYGVVALALAPFSMSADVIKSDLFYGRQLTRSKGELTSHQSKRAPQKEPKRQEHCDSGGAKGFNGCFVSMLCCPFCTLVDEINLGLFIEDSLQE